MVLENFDAKLFLSEYWQRKPLLIRNAVPAFQDPLTAEELAGLALEAEVESRLIERIGDQWHFEQGPFDETSFDRDNPWTLLVQAVDQMLPEVAQLRELVAFLPQWRLDDVMVSYAEDGGSVGPHYDNYDVFLLQGMGQRRWQLGQQCGPDEPLLQHQHLRILETFHCSQEYVLQCGDMLYLPPRVAHWGVAIGECMTYSIGLRAPRINDMTSRWLDSLLEQIDPQLFYRDPELSPALRAGEIDGNSIAAALQQVLASVQGGGANTHWFGELVTEPRYGAPDHCAPLQWRSGMQARLNPEARLAWSEIEDHLQVYSSGQSFAAPPECRDTLQLLCSRALVHASDNAAELTLLGVLHELGCLDVD